MKQPEDSTDHRHVEPLSFVQPGDSTEPRALLASGPKPMATLLQDRS